MNRGDHFDPFARVLHWGMAVLILAMLFVGVGMVASLSLRPVLIDLHRPLGIALLLLAACKLGAVCMPVNWRLAPPEVEYIVDLAAHFVAGRIRVEAWPSMEDAAIIAELTDVRGIGEWTAQMFLIFNLLRPDVLPLDDIGLQKAVATLYFADQRPSRRQLAELGERWRPWRSVATWYLWRSLDPVPVEY